MVEIGDRAYTTKDLRSVPQGALGVVIRIHLAPKKYTIHFVYPEHKNLECSVGSVAVCTKKCDDCLVRFTCLTTDWNINIPVAAEKLGYKLISNTFNKSYCKVCGIKHSKGELVYWRKNKGALCVICGYGLDEKALLTLGFYV